MSQPCDWQCVAGAEPPQFVCRRCGLQTVIRTAGDAQAVLERYPPCGVLVAQIHKQQSETPPPPGLPRRLRSYSRAVARWIAAGRPERSDQEVERIFQSLCQPCEAFDAEQGTCRVCGCRVRESGAALVNKIKMATEQCPRGHW